MKRLLLALLATVFLSTTALVVTDAPEAAAGMTCPAGAHWHASGGSNAYYHQANYQGDGWWLWYSTEYVNGQWNGFTELGYKHCFPN